MEFVKIYTSYNVKEVLDNFTFSAEVKIFESGDFEASGQVRNSEDTPVLFGNITFDHEKDHYSITTSGDFKQKGQLENFHDFLNNVFENASEQFKLNPFLKMED